MFTVNNLWHIKIMDSITSFVWKNNLKILTLHLKQSLVGANEVLSRI